MEKKNGEDESGSADDLFNLILMDEEVCVTMIQQVLVSTLH
jgi:hypothetical protein